MESTADQRRLERSAGVGDGDGSEGPAMEGLAAVSGISSSSLTIDLSLDLHVMKPRIIELCKDLFKKWSCLDDSHFSVDEISGSITNRLLKISVREDGCDFLHFVVRLFGLGTELMIDRKRELQAAPHLTAAGFGAELLGLFGNGMVQSFIDARTLTASDMREPQIAAQIAHRLREFHYVEVPGPREPQLWTDISKLFEQASMLNFEDSKKQDMYKKISFAEIREEIKELTDLSNKLSAPVVFAHNDLLAGNLMLNDAQEKLYFIDFEYGSYNFRGYDIANHFNEYPGFTFDYGLYPNKEVQYHFFRSYLLPGKPHEVSDADLQALYVETNTYRLASHVYWALWGIIQAKVSHLDLDYLLYFFLRYGEYKKIKPACFALAHEYFSISSIGG